MTLDSSLRRYVFFEQLIGYAISSVIAFSRTKAELFKQQP
jgi:hypothetical protein